MVSSVPDPVLRHECWRAYIYPLATPTAKHRPAPPIARLAVSQPARPPAPHASASLERLGSHDASRCYQTSPGGRAAANVGDLFPYALQRYDVAHAHLDAHARPPTNGPHRLRHTAHCRHEHHVASNQAYRHRAHRSANDAATHRLHA